MSNDDHDQDDVSRCLQGIRNAYSSSPSTASRKYYGSGFEVVTLDVDNDESGRSYGVVADEASMRRISIVEDSLYEVLNLSNTNDAHVVDDEKLQSITNTMHQAKKLPLSHAPHSFPCTDTYQALPSPPSVWPQRPLMVRPTPYTSTKVIGIVRHILCCVLTTSRCCRFVFVDLSSILLWPVTKIVNIILS
jgi:hypothetical protein